ncbi:MAG: (d)CMP kinase, partial [Pirellulales bacterium]|nr:(d)CMP kinase [Pirellulales bacterium]
MIVTIDGPAGAGKSTVARALAERLGFGFLDTGAMYRCVALAAMRRGIELSDQDAMVNVANEVRIDLDGDHVMLDSDDVTADIRTLEVTTNTHYAADNAGVRARLVELQREIGRGGDFVTEGRDQGTVVFPNAACKFFLTASPEERARRRVEDLAHRGEQADFDDVLTKQNQRDERDSSRDVGPLVPAADAHHVVTDGLSIDDVVDAMEVHVRARM